MDRLTRTLYFVGMFVTCGVVLVLVGSGIVGTTLWVTTLTIFMWPLFKNRLSVQKSWFAIILGGIAAGGFVYLFRDVLSTRLSGNIAMVFALIAAPVLVIGIAFLQLRLTKKV